MNVQIPESNKVEITAISVKVRCKKCGSTFGVYADKFGILPYGYDTCFKCTGKKYYFESKEKKSNYGNTTIK